MALNVLRVDPDTIHNQELIYLTYDKSSWIIIQQLPRELKQYAQTNFNEMFNIHSADRGRVLVFNKDHKNPEWDEIECFRWCKSYLNTPKFDKKVMKSYMFSGTDGANINDPLPEIFNPFYEYMKTNDNKYNQVVINWYKDHNDYIPQHSDCEADMIDNHVISVINLNNNTNNSPHIHRNFELITRNKTESIFDNVNIVLKHGTIITMGGDTQTKFTHGVNKLTEPMVERISITLRQF